jgi:hypothetical protein
LVFTLERVTEEHRLIGKTAGAFVQTDVLPVLDRLEQKDWGLARELKRCGRSRVAGVDVPTVAASASTRSRRSSSAIGLRGPRRSAPRSVVRRT